MICWNCRQEADPGSDFCMNCGADLSKAPSAKEPAKVSYPSSQESPKASYSSSPQPAPAPAAAEKPKKKFNWLAILIAVAVFFGARTIGQKVGQSMAKSGSSSSSTAQTGGSSSSSGNTGGGMNVSQDLITRHNVYVSPESDGIRVYLIVYYGNDSHVLTGLTVEFVHAKSAGYTLDAVKSAGYGNDFPSFTQVSYSETSDYAIATCKMTNLKDASRIQKLVDYDIVVLPEGQKADLIDADSYMQSILDSGWQTASYEDYSFLHFD